MSFVHILAIFCQIQVAGLVGHYTASHDSHTVLDLDELAKEESSITQCFWQRSSKSVFIPFVKLVAFLALINMCIIWIRWG